MTDDIVERARAVSIIGEIQRRGIALKRVGREFIGPCPRCGGTDRFSINENEGLWNCRQCKPTDISGDVIGLVQWLDGSNFKQAVTLLAGDDLHGGKPNGKTALGPIVEVYDYTDEAGTLLFQVTRHEPKDFRQRRPDGRGGWIENTNGVRLVPYRLPDILDAIDQRRQIFIVEGERDVDRLWSLGYPATCNPRGAGNWIAELDQYFANANVVIIGDNDPPVINKKTGKPLLNADGNPRLPGQDHAAAIYAKLRNIAAEVRLIDLKRAWPDCPPKGDVSDYLNADKTIETLLETLSNLTGKEPKPESKAQFMKGFIPPDYLIDGLMQRRFIYSLTAKTGHAKTAIALLIAELVSSPDRNSVFGTRKVHKGQALYFVGENADDIRMRLIGADSLRTDDPTQDRLFFIDGVFDIDKMLKKLSEEMDKCGVFDIIIVDTSAAYFLGNEELSNTQMGTHARMLRQLTKLPGGPTVLVLCHPIKHATEASQLLPRGGGAFLAEMDGNLTAWKDDLMVELHHTGKYRGPDFEPIKFKLEPVTTAKLHDARGRLIPTVRATVISEIESEKHAGKTRKDEDHVMCSLLKNPEYSIAAIAQDLNWHFANGDPAKSRVQKALERLSQFKLAHTDRYQWALTEKGKDVARKTSIRMTQDDEAATQSWMDMD